jgi:hypothetical protein
MAPRGAVSPRTTRSSVGPALARFSSADGLQKYARPGDDAVAEFTADHAPAAVARG